MELLIWEVPAYVAPNVVLYLSIYTVSVLKAYQKVSGRYQIDKYKMATMMGFKADINKLQMK